MFLIFVMNRPDVLPAGDLGVRVALRDRHGLAELPAPRDCHSLAEPWRPYRTVASWYIWRGIDTPKPDCWRRIRRSRDPCPERASAVAETRQRSSRRATERAIMFDLILKGGWVIDGSGGPPFRADVALLETMIAEVGRLEGAEATASHRRRRSLRCSRVHRRARPRRPHAAGRPDSHAGAAPRE